MKIKEKRVEKGLSQIELATEIGVSQSTVAGWETGSVYPRIDKLLAMAKLFGCTVDELINKEGE